MGIKPNEDYLGGCYDRGWEAFQRRKDGPQVNPCYDTEGALTWQRGYNDAKYAYDHNLELNVSQRWPY